MNPSIFPRSSGILLHVTSLPGGHGIGDLGTSAYEFVEFLTESRQKIWQVLPLGPTGYGDSPYQLFSAFAGNPLLIDLHALRARGLLSPQELAVASSLPVEHVEYGAVIDIKRRLIGQAARIFLADGSQAAAPHLTFFAAKIPIGSTTIRFSWRAKPSTTMPSGLTGIPQYVSGSQRLSKNGGRN